MPASKCGDVDLPLLNEQGGPVGTLGITLSTEPLRKKGERSSSLVTWHADHDLGVQVNKTPVQLRDFLGSASSSESSFYRRQRPEEMRSARSRRSVRTPSNKRLTPSKPNRDSKIYHAEDISRLTDALTRRRAELERKEKLLADGKRDAEPRRRDRITQSRT